ncbi:hypothetical protein CC1G_10166 [Coprinopsis cinerea okayama7|uniref:Uncharacterized protein n=1 Tax=Coprinopsis cinerea (strain Okayama-7 / 130 / ATCC MYA-4618 / FGSC 9003) TaxID=240176 RepID=A8PEG7_COPC7|nr:hypothetical protein CC1G_10166 [Coprinopsis cinerea okayama7\|eukprot:XP_001840792.2 hypothetical protein CC1G_10166 [Coprinopsis cinerea okayama7\
MQLKNLTPFLAIVLSVIGGTNAQGQSYILPWYGGQWCNDQTIVGLAIADAPTGGCRLIRSTTNGAHNVHSFAANGAGRFNIRGVRVGIGSRMRILGGATRLFGRKDVTDSEYFYV